ncbi:MAG: hypothetical protein ACE5IR_25005 [bacterium]
MYDIEFHEYISVSWMGIKKKRTNFKIYLKPDKPGPTKIKSHAKAQRRKEYAKVFLCDPFASLREVFAFWDNENYRESFVNKKRAPKLDALLLRNELITGIVRAAPVARRWPVPAKP